MPMKSAFLPSQSTNPGLPLGVRKQLFAKLEALLRKAATRQHRHHDKSGGVDGKHHCSVADSATEQQHRHSSEWWRCCCLSAASARRPARRRGEKPSPKPLFAVFVRFPELAENGRASLACRPDDPVIAPDIISL